MDLPGYFPDASVDPTEARNDILVCFGCPTTPTHS
jgi:hypothetical protein